MKEIYTYFKDLNRDIRKKNAYLFSGKSIVISNECDVHWELPLSGFKDDSIRKLHNSVSIAFLWGTATDELIQCVYSIYRQSESDRLRFKMTKSMYNLWSEFFQIIRVLQFNASSVFCFINVLFAITKDKVIIPYGINVRYEKSVQRLNDSNVGAIPPDVMEIFAFKGLADRITDNAWGELDLSEYKPSLVRYCVRTNMLVLKCGIMYLKINLSTLRYIISDVSGRVYKSCMVHSSFRNGVICDLRCALINGFRLPLMYKTIQLKLNEGSYSVIV